MYLVFGLGWTVAAVYHLFNNDSAAGVGCFIMAELMLMRAKKRGMGSSG